MDEKETRNRKTIVKAVPFSDCCDDFVKIEGSITKYYVCSYCLKECSTRRFEVKINTRSK